MIPIIVAIIVFSIIVIVHEFGHFILARKNGIFVEEFAIGMGPKLISRKRGDTIYSIRLFPIGGFCKMRGEDSSANEEGSFNSKSVGARAAVLAAGAIMNFLFALIVIFILISANGYNKPVIRELIPNMPAQEQGLKVGDQILSINNQKIRIYEDLQLYMSTNKGETLNLKIKRDDDTFDLTLTPRQRVEKGEYLIGFIPDYSTKANIFETAKVSFYTMAFYIKSTVIGFVRLFTFSVSPDEVAGPIGIVTILGEAYTAGLKESIIAAIQRVAALAALLSANLGAANLLPLPALDGGRLVFLLIEAVRKRPLNPEKEGMIHFAGLVLLMAFMVYIAFNDIIKLF